MHIKNKKRVSRLMIVVMLFMMLSQSFAFAADYAPTTQSELYNYINTELESANTPIRIESDSYTDGDGGILGVVNAISDSSYLSSRASLYLSSYGAQQDPTDASVLVMDVVYNTDPTEISQVNTEITNQGLTTYDDIYTYIRGLTNDPNTPYRGGQAAYSLMFEGGGVCASYADLTDLMVQNVGITSEINLGIYINNTRDLAIAHAWNTIDTGGGPFNADLMNGFKNGGFTVYSKADMDLGAIPNDGSISYVENADVKDFKLAYDSSEPNITLEYDINDTTAPVTISVTVDDISATPGTDSGLESVLLPDATSESVSNTPSSDSTTISFDVNSNGNYSFEVSDKAGLVTSGNIDISSIVSEYTVDFLDYDGSIIKTEIVSEGNGATAPPDQVREGYIFTGWDTDFNNVTSDLNVTGTYAAIYQVEFLDYDGSLINVQDIEEGNSATAPTDPTRDGYTFTGWDIEYSNITSDLTVTAEYTSNTTSYPVEFLDYDNSLISIQDVEEGNSATAPTDPTRIGYTFTGWDVDFSNVTSTLVVTAQYVEKTYNVTFNDFDGTPLKTETVSEGNDATPPIDPTRVDYTFNGWDSSYTNITSDLTLTAQYISNTSTTHTAVFVDFDGSNIKTQIVEEGNGAIAPNNPSRTGYNFVGWDIDYSNVTSDLTITAQYEAKVYHTVTFNANGGSDVNSISIEDGLNLSSLPTTTRVGYNFNEWQLNDALFDYENTAITSDITLNATWTENLTPQHTVTILNNSSQTNDESIIVDDDNSISEPTIPTKEHYNFIEWQVNGTETSFPLTINSDVILEAIYLPIQYVVTFTTNNETNIANETINSGELLTEPTLTKEGYTLTHWESNGEIFDFSNPVTSPVDLIAIWESDQEPNITIEPYNTANTSNNITLTANTDLGTFVNDKNTHTFTSNGSYTFQVEYNGETFTKTVTITNIISEEDGSDDSDNSDSSNDSSSSSSNSSSGSSSSDNSDDNVSNVVEYVEEDIETIESLQEELEDLSKTRNIQKTFKTVFKYLKEKRENNILLEKEEDDNIIKALKDSLETKINRKKEISLKESKRENFAIKSILNAKEEFEFFKILRAETYIESLEDKDMKEEIEEVLNEIKVENEKFKINKIEKKPEPPIVINGKKADFKIKHPNGKIEDVRPFISNGRTLSSVRVIAESLDADVQWFGENQVIKLEKGNNTVIMQIGNDFMYVNGEKQKMDIKPIIKESRSYFPARFIAEGLSSEVLWNEEYNVVFID